MIRRTLIWILLSIPLLGAIFLIAGCSSSWHHIHNWSWINGHDVWDVRSERGQLSLARLHTGYKPDKNFYHWTERVGGEEYCCPSNKPVHRWARFDFAADNWTNCGGKTRQWFIGIPYELPIALAALPAFLFTGLTLRRRIRHHRRVARGLCIHCAYDLRASPDRCPECGTTR